jgi:predicted Rossmann fold nucleotide-binding protein DprA/Smf involved in DNA uptake
VRDDLKERAAVIALLRRAGSGWPMIACDVLERGSAVALLDEAVGHRDTLFPQPARVHDLIEEAVARDGLVLSQFWPDAPPRRQHFPMRNAVMSGYAAATLVIEAGENSGARNQARLALQHGRPVVLLRDLLVHEWARALAHRPGTAVAGTVNEVLDAVERILEQRHAELSPWEATPDLASTRA